MWNISDPLEAISVVTDYLAQRGKFRKPSTAESFLWLVSEVGEMSEKLLLQDPNGWVRNNPEKTGIAPSLDDVAEEAADVIIMATLFINGMGDYDASGEIVKKLQKMLTKRSNNGS